jgi:hypothetical protein
MKKLAVVASGWHFPLHFYEMLAKQHIPSGWEVKLFVVSHRDPSFSAKEKKDYVKKLGKSLRNRIDKKLYKKLATKKDIEKLGWTYIEKPNTVGDWGNSNQWLEDHDYKEYDCFLFTHDDNFILNDKLFISVLLGNEYPDWLILANSTGMPQGNLRGSFEFFKKEMLDIMGGKFDLSDTKLTREGENNSPKDWEELYDWNSTVFPLKRLIEEKGLLDKVVAMSPVYRVSAFCIEGERGFITNTHGINTQYEEQGLKFLKINKLIDLK